MLIEQDFVEIEILRQRSGWQSSHYFLEDEITFESIDLTLPVADLYHRVYNQQMLAWGDSQK